MAAVPNAICNKGRAMMGFVVIILAPLLVYLNSVQIAELPTVKPSESVPKRTKDPRDKTADFFVPTLSTSNPKPYWPVIPIEHYQNLSRSFPPWSYDESSWCGKPEEYDKKTSAGLLFVKLQKAASSTVAGIALRIARGVGMTKIGTPCASQVKHVMANQFRNRNRTRSFMFSSVRDPTQRIISYIFYISSTSGRSMDDAKVIGRFKHQNHPVWTNKKVKWDSGYQVGYLHTGPPPDHVLWNMSVTPNRVTDLPIIQSRIHDILEQYDFLLVVERLDESLVALQLLLDLDPSDILYVFGSKESGSWTATKQKCHKLIPKTISPAIKAYLESPVWLARNYGDYLLYHAANQSLDATIEKLGRARFNETLKIYRSLLAQAQKTCESEVVFPCSPEGQEQFNKSAQSCYAVDWGCGYPCLDQHFPRGQKALMP
jgi:hypothetical protein